MFASSRNGALPRKLVKICASSTRWKDLYLLATESVLAGDALRQQHELLGQLLAEIERSPSFVVEAMKERHARFGELHTEGFEPLASASCGPQPCPDGDDDGESLEFVLALLKSHRALLGLGLDSGAAVAFAEMST